MSPFTTIQVRTDALLGLELERKWNAEETHWAAVEALIRRGDGDWGTQTMTSKVGAAKGSWTLDASGYGGQAETAEVEDAYRCCLEG